MTKTIRPSQYSNAPEYVRVDIYDDEGVRELTLLAGVAHLSAEALDVAGCGLRLVDSQSLGALIRHTDRAGLRHVRIDDGPPVSVVFVSLNTSTGQTARINRDLPAWFRACNGLEGDVQLYDYTLQARVVSS